ncbi:galactokinase-like [Bombyx mandarina]|uniref:Galactokinase-like n=1 Tax=Bombyx mandarina TaxID=7092 RepID=A0A6J2JFX7_BOMMA|nr:galactokinase-like [Bombyx mandarina]
MNCEAIPKGEGVLLRQATDRFIVAYGRRPEVAAAAPGRVNLIGEHVDYCEGFVLPVAIPFLTVVVGSYNNTDVCRVITVLASGEELEASFPATIKAELRPGQPEWANYIKGVIANFPIKVNGFDIVVVSDVPMGSGVSSSAAIEVAVFTLLEGLTGRTVSLVEKAKLCQKAEHDFPGMPCGIMDQYIVTMGKKDHALLIDCKSLEAKQVPIKMENICILVINSNVKHRLTGSEYPQRRAQCQEAACQLGLTSLRAANMQDLDRLRDLGCNELVLRRARHVIGEIQRTVEAASKLTEKNYKTVGELFYQSHDSLSKLMEVSCVELDQIVNILRDAPGVYGARMTGGGFGGCAVALVQKSELDALKQRILSQYKGKPVFFVCVPSEGARLLKLNH